jgi:predicted nucleic acid-binding protein
VRLVIDASAAIEIILQRSKSRHFTSVLNSADRVSAPDLLVPEIVNTMWKYYHFQKLSLSVCDSAIGTALGLVDSLVSCKDLHHEAFLLARSLRRPAYDMFYLALAQREDAAFLTADMALKKVAEQQGIQAV